MPSSWRKGNIYITIVCVTSVVAPSTGCIAILSSRSVRLLGRYRTHSAIESAIFMPCFSFCLAFLPSLSSQTQVSLSQPLSLSFFFFFSQLSLSLVAYPLSKTPLKQALKQKRDWGRDSQPHPQSHGWTLNRKGATKEDPVNGNLAVPLWKVFSLRILL